MYFYFLANNCCELWFLLFYFYFFNCVSRTTSRGSGPSEIPPTSWRSTWLTVAAAGSLTPHIPTTLLDVAPSRGSTESNQILQEKVDPFRSPFPWRRQPARTSSFCQLVHRTTELTPRTKRSTCGTTLKGPNSLAPIFTNWQTFELRMPQKPPILFINPR